MNQSSRLPQQSQLVILPRTGYM